MVWYGLAQGWWSKVFGVAGMLLSSLLWLMQTSIKRHMSHCKFVPRCPPLSFPYFSFVPPSCIWHGGQGNFFILWLKFWYDAFLYYSNQETVALSPGCDDLRASSEMEGRPFNYVLWKGKAKAIKVTSRIISENVLLQLSTITFTRPRSKKGRGFILVEHQLLAHLFSWRP